MNNLIGIVVPVYNTEKYVAECIESILAQTYTNFRLILVDDGSPDNAGKICDDYAQKDSRITVIHQENAGVTRARARGVKEASDCEWITFVDSDDTITKDALEHLYSYTNNETDIVISPIDHYIDAKSITIKNTDYRKLIIKNLSYADVPWGKLIKKELFTEEVFNIPSHIKVNEDNLMNIRLAFNTQNDINISEHEVYHYRDNDDSITHNFDQTLEYELLVHKYRIASIPCNMCADYLIATIPRRLLRWREKFMYKTNVKGMINNEFYIVLKHDIKKTNFHLPFVDRILFYCTSPIIRFFAIQIKKIQNIYQTIKSNS